MNGDWFNSTEYGNFGDGGKNTKRSPLGDLTRWTITKSKKILKGIERVSKYCAGIRLFSFYFSNSC